MELLSPDSIQFDLSKALEIKTVMESTFRLILFSRSHFDDDLLNSYLEQTTSFEELLSIRNAQMEAQDESEAREYTELLRRCVTFITGQIKNNVNFGSELQLFQLFRLISPEAHARHPNRYRQEVVQIGRHVCPEGTIVPSLVAELFYRMNSIKNPLQKSIYFHHELIRIHPFVDGNGRTIRMAKNWMLMFELYPPIYVSGVEEKAEYIETLESSFQWIARNGCAWNTHLEAFFDQEMNRLLRNATTLYYKVLEMGNSRKLSQ